MYIYIHIYIIIHRFLHIDANSRLKKPLKYCVIAKSASVTTKVVELGLRGSTILSFLSEYKVHCRGATPSQEFVVMDQTEDSSDMKLVDGSERQIHKRCLVICTEDEPLIKDKSA